MRAFTLVVGLVVTSLLATWELGGGAHLHKKPGRHAVATAATRMHSSRPPRAQPHAMRVAAHTRRRPRQAALAARKPAPRPKSLATQPRSPGTRAERAVASTDRSAKASRSVTVANAQASKPRRAQRLAARHPTNAEAVQYVRGLVKASDPNARVDSVFGFTSPGDATTTVKIHVTQNGATTSHVVKLKREAHGFTAVRAPDFARAHRVPAARANAVPRPRGRSIRPLS